LDINFIIKKENEINKIICSDLDDPSYILWMC
jgi:hypothetical protein